MMPAGLDAGILAPAFAAGLLVLATHVPLGAEVIRRGIIFLDLAIAQIAGLGIVAAHMFLDMGTHGWPAQVAAVTAAVAGALFLRWREKRNPVHQEAVIGVAFVAAASAAILIMAKDPHAGEHLKEMLVGQILWTTWASLLPLAAVTAAVLAAWFALQLKDSHVGFYLLFAVAVTASVQVVGVYLVFASLIVPALAACAFPRRRLVIGYALGVLGYALGLIASALFDLPSGAAIVCALVVVGGLAVVFRRRSAGADF